MLFCFIYLHTCRQRNKLLCSLCSGREYLKEGPYFTQFAIRVQRYAQFTPFSFFVISQVRKLNVAIDSS